MGNQTGLHLIQCIEPSAALVQVHLFVPFAPFLKTSIYKAPQVIQVPFNKVTVVVLPAPHQWIQKICSTYILPVRVNNFRLRILSIIAFFEAFDGEGSIRSFHSPSTPISIIKF